MSLLVTKSDLLQGGNASFMKSIGAGLNRWIGALQANRLATQGTSNLIAFTENGI